MIEQQIDPAILRDIPIFQSLTDAELIQILRSEDNRIEEYDAKKNIVREAEVGTCMYVILEGAVEVYIRGGGGAVGRDITLATLRKGDFFGDQSLDTDTTGRRNASVRTMYPTKVFRIDKKHVMLALHGEVEESEDVTIPVMRPEDREVRELIEGLRLFQSLTEKELSTIGTWAKVINVGPGDFVIKETDKGDCMYIVLEGTVEIFTFDDDGKMVMLATLNRGNHFGEQALMPGSSGERNAYARTRDIARLIQIPKAYFRLILNRDSDLIETLQKAGTKQKDEITKIHKTH
jgi:CRP-like cAMP-binding protein